MSESLQNQDLFPMGSEELMSLQADSHAKTLALRESKKALKQSDQDYGQNFAELRDREDRLDLRGLGGCR